MAALDDEKKKKFKNIKRLIYGRTLIIVLAVALQLALMIVTVLKLKDYSFYIYIAFSAITVAVVLHLYSKRGEPDFKLVWLIPITLLPIFGGIFYLFMEIQPDMFLVKRKVWKQFDAAKGVIRQDNDVRERIKKHDKGLDGFAQYLLQYDNSPAYGYTKVKYFPLGDEWFPDIIEEIRAARKFIFLEYFIIEEGVFWGAVRDELIKKVKEGVEVRVLYDGMCSLSLLPTYYPKLLKEDGIKCKIFSPIRPFFSTKYNNRDHRKIMVIDGRIAYTGGTNLADEYINQKVRFGHWKDIAVKMTGDAAQRFTFMFLEMWNVTEKKKEDYASYNTKREDFSEHDGYCIPYEVIPYGEEHVGKRVYLDILNQAIDYVHIMSPYLIIDYETVNALCYAAKRGVDVEMILPHIPDKKYAFVLAKTYYRELIEAGVKIYEYEPGFIHAKMFISDDEKAVIGSVNLDYRSFYHHFECGAFFYRNSEIGTMEQDFIATRDKSIEITYEMCRKQKLSTWFFGKIMRMIAPLM